MWMSRTPFFKVFGALLFDRRTKEMSEAILKTEQREDLYKMLFLCQPQNK